MDSGLASHPAPQVRLYNPTNIQLWVELFTTHAHAPSPILHNNPLNLTQKSQKKCLHATGRCLALIYFWCSILVLKHQPGFPLHSEHLADCAVASGDGWTGFRAPLCGWAGSLFSCCCINKTKNASIIVTALADDGVSIAVGYRCCQNCCNLLNNLGPARGWTE